MQREGNWDCHQKGEDNINEAVYRMIRGDVLLRLPN